MKRIWKVVNSFTSGIVAIAWTLLGGFLGNKLSGGYQVIEVAGVIAGASIGAYLVWSIELTVIELKSRKPKE